MSDSPTFTATIEKAARLLTMLLPHPLDTEALLAEIDKLTDAQVRAALILMAEVDRHRQTRMVAGNHQTPHRDRCARSRSRDRRNGVRIG